MALADVAHPGHPSPLRSHHHRHTASTTDHHGRRRRERIGSHGGSSSADIHAARRQAQRTSMEDMRRQAEREQARREQERIQEAEQAFYRARRQAHQELDRDADMVTLRRRTVASTSSSASAAAAANALPPTPIQHRVYLINCRGCGSFLTDRGMKAVLLLRPHITLYSTDAMPNCGPLHAPSRLAEPSAPHEPQVERTCDCLTQTLGCYGCGNAVGYHIVSPCARCTNSVVKHQRSSNGHRTVLHCAEISVRERRYVPGEPGVMVAPYRPPSHPSASRRTSTVRTTQQLFSQPTAHSSLRASPPFRRDSYSQRDEDPYDTAAEDEDMLEDDELECDEDEEDEDLIEANEKLLREQQQAQGQDPHHANALQLNGHHHRALRRGDVLFWSDLAPGGERTVPIDSDECLDHPIAGR